MPPITAPPDTERAARLVARFDRECAARSTFDNSCQEIADYMLPHKAGITRKLNPGEKTMRRIFKSTGQRALELLCASTHGTLTSPAQKWLSMAPRQDQWRQIEGMADWLEAVTDVYYGAINNSNFNAAIGEWYQDFFGFGTAAMFVSARQAPRGGFGGLVYEPIPYGCYTLTEGADGFVDTLFRRFEIPRIVAFDRWGAAIEDDAEERVKHRPEEMLEFLHACYPRPADDRRPGHRDGLSMPWASCYITMKGEKTILEEGGFRTFPYVVGRCYKMAGEVYGRSPAWTALPDVKSLNKLVELNLAFLGRVVDPPILQRNEAVLGSLDWSPASINIVDTDGPIGDAIAPLEPKRDGRSVILQINDFVNDIRDCFYADQLKLPDARPQMTAEEVRTRYELMQRLLGPVVLGRLKYELLDRSTERGLDLMHQEGVLPPPPPEVAQVIGEVDIDVRFEGPLARAQRSFDLAAIERTNQYLFATAQARPEVLDNYDFDRQARTYGEIAGVPADVIREVRAVAEMRQQRAKAQAQQQQAQTLMAAAEAGGKVAPLISAAKEPDQSGRQPVGAAA